MSKMSASEAREIILSQFDDAGSDGTSHDVDRIVDALSRTFWERRTENWQPIHADVQDILDLYNKKAGGFGVELYAPYHETDPSDEVFYVNMGDIYDLTLVYKDGELALTTLGDVMEGKVFESKARMNEDLQPDDVGYEEQQKEYAIAGLWDLGKDLYGIKPRWVKFQDMSLDELNALYDDWVVALDEKLAMEAEEAKGIDADFERAVNELVKTGSSREEAIGHLASVYLPDAEHYHLRDIELELEFGVGLSPEKAREVAPYFAAALDQQRGLEDPELERDLDLLDEYEDLY